MTSSNTAEELDLPRLPDANGIGPRIRSLSERLQPAFEASGTFGFRSSLPDRETLARRLDRADEHQAGGRWSQAAALFEQALADQPGNRRALNGVARAYAVLGRYRELVDTCMTWVEVLAAGAQWSLAQAAAEAVLRLDASSQTARLHLALARLRLNDVKGAMSVLRDLALLLLEQGRTEESLELLERAWSVAQGDPDIGMALAEVYMLTGSLQDADRQLRNLAAVLVEQGQSERAAEVYQKLYLVTPEALDVPLSLGRLYTALGRYDEAIAEFRSILKREVDPCEALEHLAEACVLAARFEDAALAARKWVQLQPDNPMARSLLGTAYLGLGRADEARELLPPVAEAPMPRPAPLPPAPVLLRHGIQAAARRLDDPWADPEERVEALDSLCQAVRYYARILPAERRSRGWQDYERQVEQAAAVLKPALPDGNLVRLTLWRGIQAAGTLLSEPRISWERKLEAQTALALAAEAYAQAVTCERPAEAYRALETFLLQHDWERSLSPAQRLLLWRGIHAAGALMEREDSPEDRVRLLETLCQAGRLYALEVPLKDPQAAFEALERVLLTRDPRVSEGPLAQHALWKGIQAAGGLLDDPSYPAERRQEVMVVLCDAARAFARMVPPPDPAALNALRETLQL
ncbi:MAG: tetratricopeptide repeat protein [Candidatus Eremiobacterota bacterium]